MRILTIDDDMINNLIMRENIKQIDKNIDVVEKMSLVDGINFLRSCKNKATFPDFIFCDLNLPPFSAKDFVRVFQKYFQPLHPAAKVYIISASVDDNHFSGIDAYDFVNGILDKLDFDNHLRQILSGQEIYSEK